MTKWKPARKTPMIGNAPRVILGQIQAAPVLIRWGLPWLLTAGGIALTSYVATKALPDIPINKSKIGLAAALGGGGFTAYLLSSTVPDDMKPIAYAAAVIGISGAAYFLFTPSADAGRITPSGEVSSGQGVPNMSPGVMLQNFVVQDDPKQLQTNGNWRQPFGDQTFDVIVENKSPQTVTFFTGAKVYGADNTLLYTTPAVAPTYGRTKTTIAPGGQEAVKVTIPSPNNWGGPKNTDASWGIEFEFFRQQNDVNPFKVSNSIPIVYTFASGLEKFLGATSPLRPVEVHDERDPYHVMGCKKCKRKKKSQPYTLPQANLIYNP